MFVIGYSRQRTIIDAGDSNVEFDRNLASNCTVRLIGLEFGGLILSVTHERREEKASN